jgi:hypothetical protein
VPVLWGVLHLGEGPGDHLPEGHSLRGGPNHAAVEEDSLELPGGL